jgi:hypothetical protein
MSRPPTADAFVAKQFIGLPPDQIDKLLASPIHEARAGGRFLSHAGPHLAGVRRDARM